MVDGEFAPLHEKIKTAISTVSNQTIKYLINTHFHGDHTGGNAPFAKDGVTIVAEVNVRNRLAAGTTPQIWMAAFDPEAAKQGKDASFPGFWLPFQDIASGNHIAQWVTRVVRQGCQDRSQCEASEECIDTVCRPSVK